MATHRAYTVAARLGLSTSLAIFVLIVIGSVVRTTGSGLACPDWPLCQGRLIPPLQFNVLIEWLHRTLALVVSLMLFATRGVGAAPSRAARAAGRAGGARGGAAVRPDPARRAHGVEAAPARGGEQPSRGRAAAVRDRRSTFTLVAESHAEPREDAAALPGRPPGCCRSSARRPLLTYAQVGARRHGEHQPRGLACPDWPTCNGAVASAAR